MSYNVIQHPRHNILSQFHVDKYLYKKKTQWKWLSASPLNREALTGEIIGLKSTGMSCFVYTPGDLHSSHPFPLSPLLAVLSFYFKPLPQSTFLQTLHQQTFFSFHYSLITSKASFSEYHSYILTWKMLLTRSPTSTVIRPAIRITSPMYRLGYQNIRCFHCQHICSMTLQVTVLFLKAVNTHLCEEYVL